MSRLGRSLGLGVVLGLVACGHGSSRRSEETSRPAEVCAPDESAVPPRTVFTSDPEMKQNLLLCGVQMYTGIGRKPQVGQITLGDLPPSCRAAGVTIEDLERLGRVLIAETVAIPLPFSSASSSAAVADDTVGVSLTSLGGKRVKVKLSNGSVFELGEPGHDDTAKLRAEVAKLAKTAHRGTISVDPKVSHGDAVRVLDLMREAGIANFAFHIDEP